LNKVAVSLLEDHLGHCVAESLRAGADADAQVREAALAVQRLLRA
jgi:DNA-binding FrmR family transcriptional regulator